MNAGTEDPHGLVDLAGKRCRQKGLGRLDNVGKFYRPGRVFDLGELARDRFGVPDDF